MHHNPPLLAVRQTAPSALAFPPGSLVSCPCPHGDLDSVVLPQRPHRLCGGPHASYALSVLDRSVNNYLFSSVVSLFA